MPAHKLAVGNTVGTFLSDPGITTFMNDPASTLFGAGAVSATYSGGAVNAVNGTANGIVQVPRPAGAGFVTSVTNTGTQPLIVTTSNDPMTT
jgi:hypothetical protein